MSTRPSATSFAGSPTSAARPRKSSNIVRNIDRYEEQKARKTVTLNEEKFLKERAEMNADKEEEKKIEELNKKAQTRNQAQLLP